VLLPVIYGNNLFTKSQLELLDKTVCVEQGYIMEGDGCPSGPSRLHIDSIYYIEVTTRGEVVREDIWHAKLDGFIPYPKKIIIKGGAIGLLPADRMLYIRIWIRPDLRIKRKDL
jgi:hypothetical protein